MALPKASTSKTRKLAFDHKEKDGVSNPGGLAASALLKAKFPGRPAAAGLRRALALRLVSVAIANFLARNFFSLRQKKSLERLDLYLNANTKTRRFQAGFTMIEVVIVMGMLVIIGSLGMFMSMENLRSGAFRNDRNAAISALQRARSLAVNNMCFDGGGVVCTDGKPHGVRFDPATRGITIFQISPGETNFDNRDEVADEFIAFDSRTTAIDAAKTIIFERLSGKSADISVILNDGAAHNSEININSEGRIDWTN